LYLTKILQDGEKGKVSWMLQNILGKNAIRVGTKMGLFSALDAIGVSRSAIDERILSHLSKTRRKANPIGLLDILESKVNANIIVFNEDGIDSSMLDSLSVRSDSLGHKCEKSSVPEGHTSIRTQNIDIISLKYNRFIVLFNSGRNREHYEKIIGFDEKLLTRYMNMFYSSDNLTVKELTNTGHQLLLEKAYFIHDLFHIFEMNRSVDDVVYSIRNAVNVVPEVPEVHPLGLLKDIKILRFSFKDVKEMKEYYASLYPSLFDSDKRLILTKKLFDRLNYIPFEDLRTRRYMFFLDILQESHFTQRENNVIVIDNNQ
jgi:hypothetical protein